MDLPPGVLRDVLETAGLLLGVLTMMGLIFGLLIGPDLLSAMLEDHPLATVQHYLAGL